MKSDPDRLLNQLVVAALTVFVVVVMLLGAVVLRHLWLQQRITELSSDVQVRLDDLGEITEEMQRGLDEISLPADEAQSLENLEEITAALDNVDEQLSSIEGNLSEVAQVLESQTEAAPVLGGDGEQPPVVRDQVDEVFTIFAVLVAAASVAIAVLLGMAVRVQQSASSQREYRS